MNTKLILSALVCLSVTACSQAAPLATPTLSLKATPQATRTLTSIPTITSTPTPAPATPTPRPTATATTVPTSTPTPPISDAVLIAGGDIASCDNTGGAQTAALLKNITGTIATLGDTAYQTGSPQEFAKCYAPTWGQFKDRTRPAPGNHDYVTKGAAGYYGFFGAAAGDPAKGYYSYTLGQWHIIALNSNCESVKGGCGGQSPQVRWLIADLTAHPAACVLAYWHHPQFSSGPHGAAPDEDVSAFWKALYSAGADIVLNGHDHIYERFAPQDPDGAPDPARGIREFVVGTAGVGHYGIASIKPNSQVRNTDTFGVLKLTLHATSYDWQFIPVAGKTFTDHGSGQCRPKP
ncbi:MAG: metallophosphoesterase [Chloroflexi bacterium]|nr:metallophosphoesterase [Chloroflexota bacterium]MCL5275193.1 metallophosphoesterase [Chloroflexota bacterium]